MVMHAYNPRYTGSRDRKIAPTDSPGKKQEPIYKIKQRVLEVSLSVRVLA
jgi:hypothetical protein